MREIAIYIYILIAGAWGKSEDIDERESVCVRERGRERKRE